MVSKHDKKILLTEIHAGRWGANSLRPRKQGGPFTFVTVLTGDKNIYDQRRGYGDLLFCGQTKKAQA